MDKEIYELKCEVCGKVIISLSENQVSMNMKQHKLTHEVKNDKRWITFRKFRSIPSSWRTCRIKFWDSYKTKCKNINVLLVVSLTAQ